MKLALGFFIALIVSIPKLTAQSKVTIKKNTVLKYMVNTIKGDTYNFNVTVNSFNANGIQFNWSMPVQKNKGVVTIYKSAIENAITYKNYFGDDTNEKLTKESTVWLSKKNFKELTTNKTSTLALDFTFQEFNYGKLFLYTTVLNNKKIVLQTFTASSTTSTNNLIILNDATNPLIIKMQVKDFTITLQSIEQ